MSEIRDIYLEAAALDPTSIHIRMEELRTSPESFSDGTIGDYRKMTDAALEEMLALTRALRRKAAAPGGPGAKKRSAAKPRASLEDLA